MKYCMLFLTMLFFSACSSEPEGLEVKFPNGLVVYGEGKVVTQTKIENIATVVIHIKKDAKSILDHYKTETKKYKTIIDWNNNKTGMLGRGDWSLSEMNDGQYLLISIRDEGIAIQNHVVWGSKEIILDLLK
ncbi:MAG: hypothetical protein AAB263_09620 [Planctomycetota bacterium]